MKRICLKNSHKLPPVANILHHKIFFPCTFTKAEQHKIKPLQMFFLPCYQNHQKSLFTDNITSIQNNQ